MYFGLSYSVIICIPPLRAKKSSFPDIAYRHHLLINSFVSFISNYWHLLLDTWDKNNNSQFLSSRKTELLWEGIGKNMNAIKYIIWEKCYWSRENTVEGRVDKIKSCKESSAYGRISKDDIVDLSGLGQRLGVLALHGPWQNIKACPMIWI